MAEKRASRDEWRKRVDRWKESGLTAKEFAAETGINAGTLQFWQYKLRTPAPVPRRSTTVGAPAVSSIVELRPRVGAAADSAYEIDLLSGRRLRMPAVFEASSLKLLLAILEGTT